MARKREGKGDRLMGAWQGKGDRLIMPFIQLAPSIQPAISTARRKKHHHS
jgi:hypothetical protein